MTFRVETTSDDLLWIVEHETKSQAQAMRAAEIIMQLCEEGSRKGVLSVQVEQRQADGKPSFRRLWSVDGGRTFTLRQTEHLRHYGKR